VRQIACIGGDSEEHAAQLLRYLLETAGKEQPSLLFVPTAQGDRQELIDNFCRYVSPFARVSVLTTFPWPPANLRELVLSQDVIFVSGGNTANMLAIWRVHGIDRLMREAWDGGILLSGVSAGMICWFECGVTDSFGAQLESTEGLAFLLGSACPHYDSEDQRRPRYRELIEGGLPAGLAVDDDVVVRFVETELHEVVSFRSAAAAYRVTAAGEERLEPRLLG
jgi:peptidase E